MEWERLSTRRSVNIPIPVYVLQHSFYRTMLADKLQGRLSPYTCSKDMQNDLMRTLMKDFGRIEYIQELIVTKNNHWDWYLPSKLQNCKFVQDMTETKVPMTAIICTLLKFELGMNELAVICPGLAVFCTILKISFVVGLLSQVIHKLTDVYWKIALRILA